jgi:predicted dehydrogenase
MTMNTLNRREFLDRSTQMGLGMTAGTALFAAAGSAKAVSPNEKIVVGVVGAGGRGSALAMGFATRPDCEIAYLADVDATLFDMKPPAGEMEPFPEALRGPRLQGLEKAQGKTPKTVQDFRRILDDKSVDVVVVATPDHWHALATIWACQAGKDVYVEKPASHNPWEGRKMVEAARKYRRIVQVGTQSRSDPCYGEAKQYITDGKLGRIHFCRVCDMKAWPNFAMLPDGDPPKDFDWDMWNGPAPEHRYNATFHHSWHHLWRYSGGDIINDSLHQLDLARWLCGVECPKAVYSTGGRFHQEGAAETPDIQIATYDFDKFVMSFELTLYTPYMLKCDMAMRATDVFPHWPQNTEHIEIYGDQGVMYVCPHGVGWQVFGRPKSRQPVVVAQKHGRFPDPAHKQNFVDCIRSRQTPNADIEEGHRSTMLSQLANISYRLGGQKLLIDPKTETILGNDESMKFFKREYRKPWVVEDRV